MPKEIDISGKRFGKLLAIRKVGKGSRKTPQKWFCVCDCGNTKQITKGSLLRGITKSCGCERKRISRERMTKHGLKKTILYKKWLSMKNRCYNKNSERFKNYGERGICVCDEWRKNFVTFYTWAIENGYKYGLSLERMDVNGNYCPNNCKWIPLKDQVFNKTNTIYLNLFGDKMTVHNASLMFGVPEKRIRCRRQMGWSDERCVLE